MCVFVYVFKVSNLFRVPTALQMSLISRPAYGVLKGHYISWKCLKLVKKNNGKIIEIWISQSWKISLNSEYNVRCRIDQIHGKERLYYTLPNDIQCTILETKLESFYPIMFFTMSAQATTLYNELLPGWHALLSVTYTGEIDIVSVCKKMEKKMIIISVCLPLKGDALQWAWDLHIIVIIYIYELRKYNFHQCHPVDC